MPLCLRPLFPEDPGSKPAYLHDSRQCLLASVSSSDSHRPYCGTVLRLSVMSVRWGLSSDSIWYHILI